MRKVKLRYTRRGRCRRCGACCLVHGCDKLKFDGKKAICTIWKKRPNYCRAFPQMPPIIFGTCGYYFLDTWENNRIIRPKEV